MKPFNEWRNGQWNKIEKYSSKQCAVHYWYKHSCENVCTFFSRVFIGQTKTERKSIKCNCCFIFAFPLILFYVISNEKSRKTNHDRNSLGTTLAVYGFYVILHLFWFRFTPQAEKKEKKEQRYNHNDYRIRFITKVKQTFLFNFMDYKLNCAHTNAQWNEC